jgi:hypothetical protein
MKRWSNPIRAVALLALITAGCDAAGPAAPENSPPAFAVTNSPANPPFYARVEFPFTIHTGEWAAIVFYRPPACVPGGFNLLDFFDVPGAFFCGPLAVAGREMRMDPNPFAAPFQSLLKGLGSVPVWLVTWADMQAALADDVVTRTELESLPSLLMGTADTFEEMLQPIPTRVPSRLVINAQGTLEDGRSFLLHYNSHDDFSGNHVRSVRIDVW